MVANNEKLCKKVQRSLQSCASPPTAWERSPSPSPVAVVNYKPMSQSENSKPQSLYLQQANVEPIVKNVSPTLLYSGNNCNEQQQINFMEGAKVKEDAQVIDNPQTMKHNIKLDEKSDFDDGPFDPNLGCRKQFRIDEIQEYRKHYEDWQTRQNGQPIQMDPVISVGHTVSMLITIAYIGR